MKKKYNYKINHNYKIMKKIRGCFNIFRGKSNYEILGNDKNRTFIFLNICFIILVATIYNYIYL